MKKLTVVLALFMLASLSMMVSAQQSPSTLDADERAVLEAINRARLTFGRKLGPLVPNTALNSVADYFLQDLLTRPLDVYYNFLANGQDISQILATYGYPSYNGAFVADIIPVRVRDYTPASVIDFLVSDYVTSTRNSLVPQVESLRMSQGRASGVPAQHPFYHRAYREIGIAFAPNDENGRFYYVLVFASTPQTFPIVIVDPARPYVLDAPLSSSDALVYLSNEDARDPNSGAIISDFEFVRFSEQPSAPLPCPQSEGDGWQRYNLPLSYRFSEGVGDRVLYMQLCDGAQRTITTFARVTISTGAAVTSTIPAAFSFPTPDVMGIVQATQTAAAFGTAYYPYAQTIEAILTSTAAPSPTPTGTP